MKVRFKLFELSLSLSSKFSDRLIFSIRYRNTLYPVALLSNVTSFHAGHEWRCMYLSLSLGMNRDSRDDEECVELERIFGIIWGSMLLSGWRLGMEFWMGQGFDWFPSNRSVRWSNIVLKNRGGGGLKYNLLLVRAVAKGFGSIISVGRW